MKECQRSLTLKQYLQNYQQLKQSQSHKNLLSTSRPSQQMLTSTHDLQIRISEKLEVMKNLLSKNNTAMIQISPLECLHELQKIINQVLQRLKTLEVHDGKSRANIQNSAASANRVSKKVSLHEKKVQSEKIRRLKSQQSPNTQLITPQQMTKQIQLSKDLSNLNLSGLITTQDFSMKQTASKLAEKSKKLAESTSSETYFRRRVQRIKSLGPDLQYGEEATADQYQIKVTDEIGDQAT